ncbi:MAG: exodeoxyribonuclease VII small subunit [Euryarchaeota archaeon]|nr:exodeoxyribonuclease VII small subunit [Euryarchaeota archaeon]|tara:strand:- start:411 stop:611 length:201 start_codon:yes stop_codon:yes gene_type:complete
MNYSESMKRIEEIVTALEAGGISLDETLKMFEEGAKLLKECQQELEQAEIKIDGIRLDDSTDVTES